MKKKIIITTAQVPFVSGGAELLVDSLWKNFKKRGFDAEVVQLPFKWYPEESFYDSMLAWRLIDLEESDGSKVDLVIATKFPSYGVRHTNKVVWLMHQFRQVYDLYDDKVGYSAMPNGNIIKRHVENYDKTALLEAKDIFSISQNVSNRLKQYNNIDSTPIYHPPSLEGRYKSAEYGDYIVSVGRLNKMKRNDLLIKALAHCDRRIKAKVAGTGPEMDQLTALAEELGVRDRVEFLGFVSDDDLLDLYAGAFAVFFAPLDEDYGYITLEAFLSKRPVVTCVDSGGVLEFAQNEKNSFVCDNAPEELGTAIDRLYNNKKLCGDLGTEGYEKVKDISWDNAIDKLTETIR